MKRRTNALAEKCENVLASVLGLAIHTIGAVHFNRRDPQQLFAVCLFARLVELASACKALLEKGTLVGIPVLLRSMFEADIDLRNMIKTPGYSKRMYASFLEQKLRLTREAASAKPNPFLAAVRAQRKPAEDLRDTQKELDELRAGGNGPIDIRCRAEFAGVLDAYLSVYNMLCLDTHNNIRSLEDWHIEATSAKDYRVVLFKQQKADLIHHLTAIPGILLVQCKALADFLGTKDIDFAPYFSELKDMQEHAKKEA
jgi:hypothetical protein